MTVFAILKFLLNFISKFMYLSIFSINFPASVVAIVLQFTTAVYFAGTTNLLVKIVVILVNVVS